MRASKQIMAVGRAYTGSAFTSLSAVAVWLGISLLSGAGVASAQQGDDLAVGVAHLRAGRIEAAVKSLDQVVADSPEATPYLWQRGIAQYFAGQFAAGRKQFESHRTVNPNDVENATWHFLCVAAESDVKAAREALLPAPGDRRVPMRELHALYSGKGDRAAVEAAVERLPAGSAGRRNARFYADLYLGLLSYAEGQQAEAAKLLKAAADVLDQNVMADVARICHARLIVAKQQANETASQEKLK